MTGVLYAPFGENNSTYVKQAGGNAGRYPLGYRLVLPDGRTYRFAMNDSTATVVANLYQSVATVTNHRNRNLDVARDVGSTQISSTLGGVLSAAAAIDIYSEGTVHVNDQVGEGYTYRIKRAIQSGQAHAAVDGATGNVTLTVNLAAGETTQVAMTTSSEVTYTRNRFHATTIHPSPPTAPLAGVSPSAVAADRFYWCQTGGEAAVLADGTLYAGRDVQASITTNGAVEARKTRVRTSATGAADVTAFVLLTDSDGSDTTLAVGTVAASTTVDITGDIAYNSPIVGVCVRANSSTEQALIDLRNLGG